MRLFIQIIFLLTLFVFICRPLLASEFVKIQDIDTSNFPKVNINIEITDPGLTRGLNENDFLIYEDGYRVNYLKITPLEKNLDGASVVFCLDSSKSIGDSFLKELKKSALNVSANLGLSDIAVYNFNDDVILLNGFSRDKRAVDASVGSVSLRGSKTVLYDAIYEAISLVEKSSKNGMVIVFTDGKDEGSKVMVQDIGSFSRITGIPVFFVTKSDCKMEPMERIAKLTGGGLVFAGNEGSVLRTFSSRLKGGYVISYHSFLETDGKEHSLEVRTSSGQADSKAFYLNSENTYFVNLVNFLDLLNRKNFYIYRIPLLLLILFIFITALMLTVRRRKVKPQTAPPLQVKKESAPPPAVQETLPENTETVEYFPLPHGQGYKGAWFIRKDGDEAGKKIYIRRKEVTIGRSKECAIVIQDHRVSPFHSKIKNAEGVFYLFDLASDNGTYLNGSKLLRPKPLYDWDEISLGKITLIFRESKIID